jgi:hypothetical protein
LTRKEPKAVTLPGWAKPKLPTASFATAVGPAFVSLKKRPWKKPLVSGLTMAAADEPPGTSKSEWRRSGSGGSR